jgi:hypothetical protein
MARRIAAATTTHLDPPIARLHCGPDRRRPVVVQGSESPCRVRIVRRARRRGSAPCVARVVEAHVTETRGGVADRLADVVPLCLEGDCRRGEQSRGAGRPRWVAAGARPTDAARVPVSLPTRASRGNADHRGRAFRRMRGPLRDSGVVNAHQLDGNPPNPLVHPPIQRDALDLSPSET